MAGQGSVAQRRINAVPVWQRAVPVFGCCRFTGDAALRPGKLKFSPLTEDLKISHCKVPLITSFSSCRALQQPISWCITAPQHNSHPRRLHRSTDTCSGQQT